MSQSVLAVGVDPAKRLHRAVAVMFPDQVVLDIELPNALDALANLDDRLCELAKRHGAELVDGLEDHRHYGRLFFQVLTQFSVGRAHSTSTACICSLMIPTPLFMKFHCASAMGPLAASGHSNTRLSQRPSLTFTSRGFLPPRALSAPVR